MTISGKIFLDSSFFKAFIDQKDQFHVKAHHLWQKFQESDTPLLTSNYILIESFTLIKFRCGKKIVKAFKDLISESTPYIEVKRVTISDKNNAWDYFLKGWGKLSFTDCVTFAQMKRLGLLCVATFDDDFARAGFSVEQV